MLHNNIGGSLAPQHINNRKAVTAGGNIFKCRCVGTGIPNILAVVARTTGDDRGDLAIASTVTGNIFSDKRNFKLINFHHFCRSDCGAAILVRHRYLIDIRIEPGDRAHSPTIAPQVGIISGTP